jgi:hypothetical protein
MELRDLILGFMLWFLFPLWMAAGIADYLLHRRTDIEHTSGRGESALHVLQAIQVGIALLAGLFLEITTLVLAVMILCVVAHTATALWDGLYSAPRRHISPIEQHVHSHLEYIPVVAVAMVALLHWDAVTAPSFALQLKRNPVPLPYLLGVLIPILLVHGALLGEEALRTWRGTRIAVR